MGSDEVVIPYESDNAMIRIARPSGSDFVVLTSEMCGLQVGFSGTGHNSVATVIVPSRYVTGQWYIYILY